MTDKKCYDDGNDLQYVGDLGSPGVGQSWECPECGTRYWVSGNMMEKFSNLEPEDVTMDEFNY